MQCGQTVIAKPLNGLRVRKEDGSVLPDEGDTVIYNTYWLRREDDGDVALSLPAKAKKTAATDS